MSFKKKFGTALRDMHESLGDKGTVTTFREMLEEKKLRPEDCSIQEIFESVSSDLAPVITGEVINAKIIQAFNEQDLIGDKLCTTIPSKYKTDKITGWEAVPMPDAVPEGAEYNESDFAEKYVESTNAKFGRLISVTEEMVKFDQTRSVLEHARKIGQKAALHRERKIIYGIQDLVDYKSYYPSGVQTDLYSTTNGNLVTSAPYGESGLLKILEAIHEQSDEENDPIFIPNSQAICLVPINLWIQAVQMSESAEVPEGSENAKNVFRGTFIPLTSPYVSNQSETTWYYGNGKEAFVWTEVWPLEVLTQVKDTGDLFTRDIAARYKVRYFGNLACVNPKYFYKATA